MKNIALVIEDDTDLSSIFVKALEQAGFEVEPIQDGEIAQKRLLEVVPQVIVLDLHLPHINGGILLKQIQATEALNKTRIIITTADAEQADMYRGKVTIVMVKPISYSQLRDISARLKIQE